MTPLDNPAAIVETAWRRQTVADKHRPPGGQREYVYASGWHPCARSMALDLLHPEDRQFSDDTYERFREGDAFEAEVRSHLTRAGRLSDPRFEVVSGQERFEVLDDDGTVLIVGKMEGELRFEGEAEPVPFEVKGGVSVLAIDDLDGMFRSPWARRYPYQLASYMAARNRRRGLFILRRPGLPQFVELDHERAVRLFDEFKGRARQAVAARRGGEMPDYQLAHCRQCEHMGKSCHPPIDAGEGMVYIDDEELVELARVVAESEEQGKAYNRARDKIAKALRGKPLVNLAGLYEVRGTYGSYTRYDIPSEVKDEYRVVDPEGRWTWELVPLTPPEETTPP